MEPAGRAGCVGEVIRCRSPMSADQVAYRRFEVLWGTRLLQHEIAAGALRAAGIGGKRCVAGHRDDRHLPCSGIPFQAPRQLVAVDPRNVQIGDNHVWNCFERALQGLETVVRLTNREPGLREPFGVQAPAIAIVLNEQHAGPRLLNHPVNSIPSRLGAGPRIADEPATRR